MQHFIDLQWLDIRLEKLKLYLEEFGSNLTHLESQHKTQRPQFQDVERHLEYAKPRISDFKPSFRGLEPRIRTLRSLSQMLLVFGLFQHIFALALPDRFDRVRPLLDAANATNINVTILDAVRDKQIAEDAWPKGWSENHEKKVGELGCLMSHVRTWKKMIVENIESALIMESDADWDLRIREIMQGVASASKHLVDWPFDAPTRPGIFPYGDKWDIIWIGHCGSWNHENHRIYSFNDSTVPPEDYEYTFTDTPREEQHRPGTRSVFPLGYAVCSTAYAISNAGAVKLEEEFREGSDNIDLRLAQICRENQDVNCLGVWPQLITAAITETNIEHPLGEIVTGDMAVTAWYPGPGLQYSARLNADKVLHGSSMEEWDPQWNSTWALKNETWTQVEFEEAKQLEAEIKSGGEEKNGRRNIWEWSNGKHAGTRSFH
ncbi:MAG: hypothetical protein ALECFALPRED_004670 [Alectoria fallacina]|uniref:Glycosyl transferase family 25 domain-containing protein n=1 Tax=Alectoria fallacina TaxID=1903189 RepID=A0A8H3I5X0_9LECA|nr:MAG: hypothetical protein ALECFALPRED_004670 [Alectoria fallacina]